MWVETTDEAQKTLPKGAKVISIFCQLYYWSKLSSLSQSGKLNIYSVVDLGIIFMKFY